MSGRVVIIGGGISGATTAYDILRRRPDAEVVLLERDEALGGTARAEVSPEGYTVDWGPNGFLTNVPHSLDLAVELGLAERLQPASDLARFRFIFKDEQLKPLPLGPGDFLASDFVSWPGKLRMALEPFIATPEDHRRETVHGFAARRLGEEFAQAFMHPMILGITSGDSANTNLDALFPRMRALEVEHGSLVAAMVSRVLERQRSAANGAEAEEEGGGPAGPGGRLTSFGPGGVQVLLDALGERLGDRVRLASPVARVEPGRRGGWSVALADNDERVEADAVVLATPSYTAARLVEGRSPQLAEALDAIPYASVRVLALGFDPGAIPGRMDGFGFLVPRGQGVRILGCLWTSTIFPSQAPHDKVLLRIIAGGVFDPGFVDLSDEEALWEARRDLSRTMRITEPPEFVRQIRWRDAIPQYGPEHLDRVARIDQLLQPGLFVTGNAYKGLGLNDCVKNARLTAEAVVESL